MPRIDLNAVDHYPVDVLAVDLQLDDRMDWTVCGGGRIRGHRARRDRLDAVTEDDPRETRPALRRSETDLPSLCGGWRRVLSGLTLVKSPARVHRAHLTVAEALRA